MKYLILAGLLLTSVLGGYTYLNQGGIGGEGTINQLQQWKFDGTYLTQSVTDRVLKFTGLESAGDCLVTNASGVVSTSACGTGGGGTPGGSTTQVQFNNAGSFAGDSGMTYSSSTDTLSVVSINATNSTTTRLAVTGTGTSTFSGGINTGANHIVTHGVQSDASDGLHVHAGNGTDVALFGAGNTANSLFYGAVNIDGNTRIATTTNGVLVANSGTVTASGTPTVASIVATGTTATSTFAGAVGIGTSTPTQALSVVGNTLVSGTSSSTKVFAGSTSGTNINGPEAGWGSLASICDGCGASSNNLLVIGNYSAGGTTGVSTFSARGTSASPTATQSGDDIYFMGGRGYGSSTWGIGSKVSINMEASQAWTDSAQGTKITLSTTPNNSTTRADVMTIDQSAKVGIGTTTPSQPLSVVGTTTMDRTEITSSLWLLGDYITNTLTWLDTKVEALTNVVLQGIWDFGGATSIEIVNGTAPTVDAIGEIAFDTTDNQLLIATSTVAGSPMVIPNTVSMGSFLIASTSMPFGGAGFATGKAIPFKIHRDGYNVTEIYCDIDGGTSIVINFDNGTGNTSAVTCDTDGASLVGVGSNNTVTAGLMTTAIETGTVTGAPNYLRVSVFGTYTRE